MAEIRLTPAQQAAVENRGGALLVSAAAGSGKTKVLVDRLLSYVEDENDPANIDEFLIITYTKAAASELRGKISAEISKRLASKPENRHLQRRAFQAPCGKSLESAPAAPAYENPSGADFYGPCFLRGDAPQVLHAARSAAGFPCGRAD